jgi:hypothetical protein
MTSRFQHKMVMQELSVLVTKCDIQKALNVMLPAKRHKIGRGDTSGILPKTLCPPGLITDLSDTANTTPEYDEDTFGDDTAREEPVVQELGVKYILGDN